MRGTFVFNKRAVYFYSTNFSLKTNPKKMNATLKTVLIAAAVYIALKALDRLFLDAYVWDKFLPSHFEAED